jgi:hypothetical protein
VPPPPHLVQCLAHVDSQLEGVFDGHAATLSKVGLHRMCTVTQQRHTALAPGAEGVCGWLIWADEIQGGKGTACRQAEAGRQTGGQAEHTGVSTDHTAHAAGCSDIVYLHTYPCARWCCSQIDHGAH